MRHRVESIKRRDVTDDKVFHDVEGWLRRVQATQQIRPGVRGKDVQSLHSPHPSSDRKWRRTKHVVCCWCGQCVCVCGRRSWPSMTTSHTDSGFVLWCPKEPQLWHDWDLPVQWGRIKSVKTRITKNRNVRQMCCIDLNTHYARTWKVASTPLLQLQFVPCVKLRLSG